MAETTGMLAMWPAGPLRALMAHALHDFAPAVRRKLLKGRAPEDHGKELAVSPLAALPGDVLEHLVQVTFASWGKATRLLRVSKHFCEVGQRVRDTLETTYAWWTGERKPLHCPIVVFDEQDFAIGEGLLRRLNVVSADEADVQCVLLKVRCCPPVCARLPSDLRSPRLGVRCCAYLVLRGEALAQQLQHHAGPVRAAWRHHARPALAGRGWQPERRHQRRSGDVHPCVESALVLEPCDRQCARRLRGYGWWVLFFVFVLLAACPFHCIPPGLALLWQQLWITSPSIPARWPSLTPSAPGASRTRFACCAAPSKFCCPSTWITTTGWRCVYTQQCL